MAKNTAHYTTQLTKVLKKSDRIICNVSDSGDIYITNGFALFILSKDEYRTFVQPVTMREPSNYDFTASGCKPCEPQFIALFAKYIGKSGYAPVNECPFSFSQTAGRTFRGFFYKEKGSVIILDAAFVSAVSPDAVRSASDPLSPVIFYRCFRLPFCADPAY